ncbi:hypothetical protein SAMN03080598_03779 [Algoriphagus boritolerans DSM 17298 = JCM 18970]|uniref:Uncharacterized protein n=2 Tax=Algoriphagus TaxID=246875 RepID=A0A1H5ZYI4_9BACT|nr:hypothetical protein SAMN03080598_03779 [Algoriphagus boritolerans DSM 17298 = JCM 18970]
MHAAAKFVKHRPNFVAFIRCSCLFGFTGCSFIKSPFAGPVSGFAYFLYTPIRFAHGSRAQKKREELLEGLSDKTE